VELNHYPSQHLAHHKYAARNKNQIFWLGSSFGGLQGFFDRQVGAAV
jgi:hypothetical protein